MAANAEGVAGTGANGGAAPASAAGSGVDNAELEKRVNEIINKAIGPRLSRVMDKIESMTSDDAFDKRMEAWSKKYATPDDKPDADGGAGDQRPTTIKALEQKLVEQDQRFQQELRKRDEALAAEKQKATDAQIRSEAHAKLAGVLGADNPNLPYLMDSLHGVQKRFALGEDGRVLVKFKGQYGGEDDFLPLEEGVKRLAESEIKHLVPSKTSGLPSAGPGRQGTQLPPSPNGKRNPLDQIFANAAHAAAEASADPTRQK